MEDAEWTDDRAEPLPIAVALAETAETRPISRLGGIRLSTGGAVGQSLAKCPPDAGPIGERLFLARHELDGELRVAGAAQSVDALLDLGFARRERRGADQVGGDEPLLLRLDVHQVPAMVLEIRRILG